MNLTKDQRNALAQKLSREINEENKKNFVPNKSANDLIHNIVNLEIEKINKQIDKVNIKIEKLDIHSSGSLSNSVIEIANIRPIVTEDTYGRVYFIGKSKSPKYISPETIKEELILGEIDTPDLEQLIKKIKDKFK